MMYGDDKVMTYGDDRPATMVSAQVTETLQWCLRVLVGQDQANAGKELVSVQYSPLTAAVAEALHTLMSYQPLSYWPPGTQETVEQVLSYAATFTSPGYPPPV